MCNFVWQGEAALADTAAAAAPSTAAAAEPAFCAAGTATAAGGAAATPAGAAAIASSILQGVERTLEHTLKDNTAFDGASSDVRAIAAALSLLHRGNMHCGNTSKHCE